MLLERFPPARLLCLEPSAERLEQAKADRELSGRSLVSFEHGDVDEHFSAASLTAGGSLYDLVFCSDAMHRSPDMLGLLERQLNRIRPGGTLAMQVLDESTHHQQPAHALLTELAAELGVSAALDAATADSSQPPPPSELAELLLGPLCASLDMWSTTYTLTLPGEEAVYDHMMHGGDGGVGGGRSSSCSAENVGSGPLPKL